MKNLYNLSILVITYNTSLFLSFWITYVRRGGFNENFSSLDLSQLEFFLILNLSLIAYSLFTNFLYKFQTPLFQNIIVFFTHTGSVIFYFWFIKFVNLSRLFLFLEVFLFLLFLILFTRVSERNRDEFFLTFDKELSEGNSYFYYTSIDNFPSDLLEKVIAKLQNKTIVAPFSGMVGTRGISSSILGTDSMIVTLDDSKKILCDLQIPEVFASILKKNLKVNAKFLAYKNKLYTGAIISHASRVDAQTRSILARAQINNKNLEILPGSLLDIEVLYDEKDALSVADTSIIFEDEKKFVYKILDNNKIEKTEVTTGIRKGGNLEVLDGLIANDKVVKEGLARLSDGMVVKPLIK